MNEATLILHASDGLAFWLPVVWLGVLGFGVLMYVLLDGFVLGLGILAPLAEDGAQFDHMMNTAAPIWDGNETWLVLGGAGLLAAFPRAYALVLSALYLPVLTLLLGLIFRGVAFEFRFKGQGFARRAWGAAFSGGSIHFFRFDFRMPSTRPLHQPVPPQFLVLASIVAVTLATLTRSVIGS